MQPVLVFRCGCRILGADMSLLGQFDMGVYGDVVRAQTATGDSGGTVGWKKIVVNSDYRQGKRSFLIWANTSPERRGVR